MDGYKRILVHLDDGAYRAARVEFAADLAQRFDARLAGLYATNLTHLSDAGVDESGQAITEVLRHALDQAKNDAHLLFDRVVHKYGFPAVDWWCCHTNASACVTAYARYVDLVIVEQPGGGDSGVSESFLDAVLLGAGRPLLIVPRGAPRLDASIKHIVIAWNGSREITRAVNDALPLLKGAERVTVAAVQELEKKAGPATDLDIGDYLARHGVMVSFKYLERATTITQTINPYVAETDANLIVMGAYGYSRLAEIVLGSATTAMLKEMTVPVLMSH